MAFFGLAYNLHRFPENEIYKGTQNVPKLERVSKHRTRAGALQIAEKQLAKRRRLIDWGPRAASVPVMTMVDVALVCVVDALCTHTHAHAQDKSRSLTVIDGLVYDVKEFAPTHPG
jgi:cytochrome b involved in lipid metabolism